MVKILITRDLPDIGKTILKDFEVHQNKKNALTKNELIEAVQLYDGILSTFLDFFDKDILKHATQLKVLSNWAVGTDNIDCAFAKEKNIVVHHLPDIVTISTAEMTLALLLAIFKNVCPANTFVKDGKWNKWDPTFFVGQELHGKTLGIVGFGRIGLAVAKRALGFGMRVLFHKRTKIDVEHCKQVDLDTLLKSSDVVSLHMPLTKETRGMVDLDFLKKMQPSATLLNLARGAVINQNDLIFALKNRIIKQAALDVTDPEPLGKHELANLDNVIITPHIGTATIECRTQMTKKAAENLLAFFNV